MVFTDRKQIINYVAFFGVINQESNHLFSNNDHDGCGFIIALDVILSNVSHIMSSLYIFTSNNLDEYQGDYLKVESRVTRQIATDARCCQRSGIFKSLVILKLQEHEYCHPYVSG